jgi:hypothetical protein
MTIYHQNNIAAFAGNHIFYWVGQPLFHQRISITSAAAPGGLFPFLSRKVLVGGMYDLGGDRMG